MKEFEEYLEDIEFCRYDCFFEARDALIKFGEKAVPPLIELLGHYNERVRHLVSDILLNMHGVSFNQLAKAMLHHPSVIIRTMAALTLMDFNDSKIHEEFWKAYENKDWHVISLLSWFFISQGRFDTVDTLIQALEKTDSERLAYGFCQCGNEKLHEASVQWAQKHGRRVWPDCRLQAGKPVWGEPPLAYPWFKSQS